MESKNFYLDQSLLKKDRILGFIILLALFTNILVGIPDLITWYIPGLITSSIVTVSFALLYFLHRKFNYPWVGFLFLIVTNAIIFYYANILGQEANAHLFFIVVILLLPFTVDVRRIVIPIIYLLFVGGLYALLVVTDYNMFPTTASPALQRIFNEVNFFIALVQAGIGSVILYLYYQNTEKSLALKNADLHEQNVQLNQLNKQLDEYVYHISHDLKTPLASLQGLIAIIDKEKKPEKIMELRDIARKSLSQMEKYIEDLLQLSRNKSQMLDIDTFDLGDLVAAALGQNQFQENYKEVEVVNEVKDFPVTTDRTRLSIVLNNLISNSFKYHNYYQDHPELKVTAERPSDHKIVIRISDNGLGIAEKDQKNIFEMFYRGPNRNVGSGLGLYITREIIHKLGGKITLSSAVNEGSTFEVTLPML